MEESCFTIISKIIEMISCVMVLIGGTIAYKRWHTSVKLKRAEYLDELIEKIRTDTIIKDIIYKIDYGKAWYTKDFHNGGELECKVDYTLSYFSYLYYLKMSKIITNEEFSFFSYQMHRIMTSRQVIDYLFNIYHFAKLNKTPMSFVYLLKYAEDEDLIDSNFYDKDSYKVKDWYHHYLNF